MEEGGGRSSGAPETCGADDVDHFQKLELACALQVFSYLSTAELGRATAVCRGWRSLASDEQLWERQVAANPHAMLAPQEALLFSRPEYESAGGGVLLGNTATKGAFKSAFLASEGWRKGQVADVKTIKPRCGLKQQAVRVLPGGGSVVATGQLPSAFHTLRWNSKSGEVVRATSENKVRDPTTAISGNGTRGLFRGGGGRLCLYDLTCSKLIYCSDDCLHREITSVALNWAGDIAVTGGIIGQVSVCKLPPDLAPLQSRAGLADPPLSIQRAYFNGSAPTDITVTALATLECPSTPPGFVGGSDKGHLQLFDIESGGGVRNSFVGSCSCPVSCVAGFGGGGGGLVAAAFEHRQAGHGHRNAAYVWDALSGDRVALLHPAGNGRLRGSSAVGASLVNGQVAAIQADTYKLALATGKIITVFETRQWQPLYELSLSVPPPEGADALGARVYEEPIAMHFWGQEMAVACLSGCMGLLSFGDGDEGAHGVEMRAHVTRLSSLL